MGSGPERAESQIQALRPGFSLGVAESRPYDARAYPRLWHDHAILDWPLRGFLAQHVASLDLFLSVVGILRRIDRRQCRFVEEGARGAPGISSRIGSVECH